MSRLSIGLRLYAVVLIACAALIALIVYSGLAAGRAAMAQKQEELRHIAQSGVSIAAGFADKAKSGAMSEDEAKAAAASAIGAMRYGDGEYLWINDMGPRMVMHPIKPELNGKDLSTNADPNGKRLFVEFVSVVRADGAGVVDYLWPKPGQSEPVAKTSYVVGLPAWGWVIGTGVYIDKLEAAVWSRLQRDLAVGAALVALLLGAAFVLVRTVTRPLAAIGSAMGELSSGRNVEIPGLDRADEIGAMSRAVAVFRDASIERQKLAAAQDQSQTAAAERAVQVEAAVRGFRSEIQRLLGAVSRNAETLTGAAGDLASIAGSTADRAASSAHSSTEASASVGSVASAAEEMAASIQEIGRQVSRTTEVVGRAAESAERTNGTVQSLAEAAARIGDVVALIQAIAQQTNLLALNATIEAARAGEAGRGFAVVATEVKSLATQTAKATEDIGAQVAAIQGSTGEAVDAIQAITAIMREANGYAAAIAAAVEEQSAATAEISRSVQDAARSTSAVNDDIGAVAASTGEVTGSSRRVGSSAADLSDVVGQLQTSVDGFLRKVAA